MEYLLPHLELITVIFHIRNFLPSDKLDKSKQWLQMEILCQYSSPVTIQHNKCQL